MSYNITALKVKTIGLTLPLTFDLNVWLASQPDSYGNKWCLSDMHETQASLAKNTWKLLLTDDHEISGLILDGALIATKVECYGEGSGTIWGDIIVPLFKEFKGSLNAIVVWEGGDTVERVTITEGEYAEEQIE